MTPHPLQRIRRLSLTTFGLWTLAIGLSLAWNIKNGRDNVMALAAGEARSNLNKDRAFRLWMSAKGGLYAAVGENTQPNPHLAHLPDRDVTTTEGQPLTLINPATAIREVGEGYRDLYGIRVRITGRVYLRPQNAPDPWELKGLEAFEAGAQEVSEVVDIDGAPHMRVMRPMYMEPSCLRCHAVTGIQVGQLRGGTGVAVPLAPYFHLLEDTVRGLWLSHLGVWGLGVGLIGFAAARSRTHERRRAQAEDELRRFSRAVEQSANGTLITDVKGTILYVNPRFCETTGYPQEEAVGHTPQILKSGQHDAAFYREMWTQLMGGGEWRGELKNRKKSGEVFWCMETISSLKDADGRITHFVAVIEDLSKRRFAEETIRRLAYFDPLTDLPNRLFLQGRVEQLCTTCKGSGGRAALLFIDLDRFKVANDHLGHTVGDTLLRIVAKRLAARLRDNDLLARLGADEFAVLLTGELSNHEVASVTEGLMQALRQPLQVQVQDHEFSLSACVGISLFPDDADGPDELLQRAEIALHAAKAEGRDRIHFYSPETQVATLDLIRIEHELRLARARGQLSLVYQPKIGLSSGRVEGVEALIRWNHPELGPVTPDRFIPLAEESSLILEIGAFVLRTACRQMREWDEAGLPPISMAVNLSPRQCELGSALVAQVLQALADNGIDPVRLELEITEGMLMKRPEEGMRLLRELRALGIGISIDDFGTGYSSLSQLRNLPVNVLKIDRSFVARISEGPEAGAIIQGVIFLAKALDLGTVAEGVETEEQVDVLTRMGCDLGQGYFYSQPLPPEEIPAVCAAFAARELVGQD